MLKGQLHHEHANGLLNFEKKLLTMREKFEKTRKKHRYKRQRSILLPFYKYHCVSYACKAHCSVLLFFIFSIFGRNSLLPLFLVCLEFGSVLFFLFSLCGRSLNATTTTKMYCVCCIGKAFY